MATVNGRLQQTIFQFFPRVRSFLDLTRLRVHRVIGAKKMFLGSAQSLPGALRARVLVLEEEAFTPETIDIPDFSDASRTHSHTYLPRRTVAVMGGWFDFRTGVAGLGKFAIAESKTNIDRAGLVPRGPKVSARLSKETVICVGMARWNYYHWLVEELPALLRALSASPSANVLIADDAPRWVSDSLNFLGVPFFTKRGIWKFDTLILATRNSDPGWPHPADVGVISDRFAPQNFVAKPGAYFASRVLSSRKFSNEEEVAAGYPNME